MASNHVMILVKLADIAASSHPRFEEALKSYEWEKSKLDPSLWRAIVTTDEEDPVKISTSIQKQLITAANYAEAGAFLAAVQVGNSQPQSFVFKKGDKLKWNRSPATW